MRKYVALIDQGPEWLEGKSPQEQGKPLEEHFFSMQRNYDSGILDLGGAFDGGGGMAVLNVVDEAAARAVMDADPGVVAGVLVYQLRTLEVVFDASAKVGADG